MSIKRWWGTSAHTLAGAWTTCINLESPQGQAVLDDLARLCFVGRTTAETLPMDPLALAFNEGKRAVFLHVCEALGVRVAEYMVTKYQEELSGD